MLLIRFFLLHKTHVVHYLVSNDLSSFSVLSMCIFHHTCWFGTLRSIYRCPVGVIFAMRTLPRPWQQASVSCATNFSTRHQSSHGPTLWTKFLHNFCVLILDHSFFPFCHLLRSTPFLRVSSCHVCFISKETKNSGSIAFSAASFRNLGTIDSDSLDAENWDLNSGSRDAAR